MTDKEAVKSPSDKRLNISKKAAFPALVLIIVGLLVAVVPWTVTPVCEVPTEAHPTGLWVVTAANKTLPMPCGYTARAEIGVGAAIVVAGGAVLFAASAASVAALGIVGVALGGLTIALPTMLTKTCALASHTCNTMTAPALELLGVGIIGLSLGMVAFRQRLVGK